MVQILQDWGLWPGEQALSWVSWPRRSMSNEHELPSACLSLLRFLKFMVFIRYAITQ